MKQAIYQGIEQVALQEVEKPGIDSCGVLVQNLCASICGSDVSAYFHGGDFAGIHPGDEFGHEMVSRVVQVGEEVKGLQVGDRVYPFPIMAKADPSRAGTLGGYSEYIALPQCKVGVGVFPVDECISDEESCLIEPLTVGCHAARMTAPQGKKTVVFGAGMIGMASAICLKYLGAEEIVVTDVSPLRLDIAEKMGFRTCNVAENDLEATLKSVLGEARGKVDADIYIDAAGVASNIAWFLDRAKFGAKLCVTAVHHQPIPMDLMKLNFGQLQVMGSPAYDFSDVATVMELLKSKRFDVTSLITHRYPIDRLEEALHMAADAQHSLKVIIDYR